jgi:thiol-disulfide isomerase/thioredoxin
MGRKIRIPACVLLAAGIAAAISGCGGWGGSSSKRESAYKQESTKPSRGEGSSAPRSVSGVNGASLFRLPMVDGRPVTVRSPAILFFFTSWCGYCKQVMPEFKNLTQRARNQGWRVYGIDVGEGAAKANSVIQQFQPNFPVLLDQQSLVGHQYNLEGYPTFVVIDESGSITYNGHTLPPGF